MLLFYITSKSFYFQMSLKWSLGTQDLCTIRVLYRANACNRTLDDLQLSLRDLSSKDSESNPGLLALLTKSPMIYPFLRSRSHYH